MIYFDNNSTTPLHPKVKEKIIETLDMFGNPSSAHEIGRSVRYLIDESRNEIAGFLNCLPEELIFTASGSEANNTVLKSAVLCCGNASCDNKHKTHIISTKIEHPSVLNTLKCLEAQNVEVTYLDVDEFGMINPDDVEKAIKKETSLISIMYANNEIGTILPIEEISEIAKKYKIPFHTDAVQAIGKVPIDLSKINVDYLSLSGHKIYAPKGIGVLFKRNGTRLICPLINGGHQENSLRAGTENTIGIIAIGEAFKQLKLEMNEEIGRVKYLRDRLEKGIYDNIPNVKLNGHPTKRLPGTLNISFKNIEGESILLRLDLYGIEVSTGSACSTGSLEPSHVIMALGVIAELAHSSIRFSLGRDNTEEEVDKTIIILKEVVEFLEISVQLNDCIMNNKFSQIFSEWEKTNNIIDKDSNFDVDYSKNLRKKTDNLLKIDLHGLTKIEALNKLKKFVEINQKSDIIKIIIIHGVGIHSKEKPVLKEAVRQWLSNNKLIRNFRPAQTGEGGVGATVAFIKAI